MTSDMAKEDKVERIASEMWNIGGDDRSFAQHLIATVLARETDSVQILWQQVACSGPLAEIAHGTRLGVLLGDEPAQVYAFMEESRDPFAPMRMRAIASVLTIQLVEEEGVDIDDLPDVYVIMIAPFSDKATNAVLAVDEFVMLDPVTRRPFGDGEHFVIADLNYVGTGGAADMIHDFRESDPAKIGCSWMAERVAWTSNPKGALQQARNELDAPLRAERRQTEERVRRRNALALLELGKLSKREIADAVELPLATVKEPGEKAEDAGAPFPSAQRPALSEGAQWTTTS